MKEINDNSLFLVPHFQTMGPEFGPGHFSKLMISCPTFLALDNIERKKVQAGLNLCRTCTAMKREKHECSENALKYGTCSQRPDLNKVFCQCNDCASGLSGLRRRCMEAQEMFISASGQKILLNGGKSMNHVRVLPNPDYDRHDPGIKTLSANFTSLNIASLSEMQAKLKINNSVSGKLDRFSLVNIRGQDGREICLILDSGASTSTISSSEVERFYHVIMDDPVALKVATGETSVHREAVTAMPLKDGAGYLAISFLIVEHQFDNIASVGTKMLAEGLYNDYL